MLKIKEYDFAKPNKSSEVRIYLNIPSSLVSDTFLYRESIISTFGDCVRTHALYFEIRGHCLELTTWEFQQGRKKETVMINWYFGKSIDNSSLALQTNLPQQLMGHRIGQASHGTHPYQWLWLELLKPLV